MKTLKDKRCMILMPEKKLWEQVMAHAKRAGFDGITHSIYSRAAVFGAWRDRYEDSRTLTAHSWDDSLFKQHPDWPRFDATTQMDEIIAHFKGEPTYDETPLPHDMDKELAEQTKKKFNLSPEQWDAIPPLAREALAQTEVKVVYAKKDTSAYNWISVKDRLPDNSDTVLVTTDPTDSRNNVHNVSAAYHSGPDWIERDHRVRRDITHWAELPPEMDPGEGSSGDEQF